MKPNKKSTKRKVLNKLPKNVVSISRGNMTVHPDIATYYPASIDAMKKKAITVGLNIIDYDGYYEVEKTHSKDDLDKIYANKTLVLKYARAFIIGDPEEVSLIFISHNGFYKLLPIVKCIKLKKNYKIETLNSFYILKRVDI